MEEKIIRILKNIAEREISEITEDTELVADMGLSSLDVIDAVVAFEEEFQTEIPDEIIAEFVTVGDIVRYFKERR